MIDVTERIKSLTNNYKITKKENLPAFVDICKQLKFTSSSQSESVRSMRMECTKVLNSTVKKNIFRDFLVLDGLSILSEWITNCSDHVDEAMLKDLISIVNKLNQCGGLDVSIIKKSKIGKILSSISKSTNFSKTIKTSVDELIQDWKQKFVKESTATPTTETSSPTIPKKKPTTPTTSTPSGEKRKRSDDQSPSPTQDEQPSNNLNRTNSIESMPKKVKSEESSKKKKRVSWSTDLEKVRLIEPRQAFVEEINHKSVQELMNEEKSNERVLMAQQKQIKNMILSGMRNTVNYVTPLRTLLATDKPVPVEVNSSEANIIYDMVRSSPSIIVSETPSSPVPPPTETITNLLSVIGLPTQGSSNIIPTNRFPTAPVINPPPPSPVLNQNTYQQPPPLSNNYSNPYPPHHQTSPYHHQQSPYISQRGQPPMNHSYYQSNRSPGGHVPPPQQHMNNYHPPQQQQQHPYQNNSGGNKSKPVVSNQYSNSNSTKQPMTPVQNKGEPRTFKPIKCLYYVKGQCKNGNKCSFYHEGYDQPCSGIEDYDFEKARFYQTLREKKR